MRRWRQPVNADSTRLDPQAVFNAGITNHHISNTSYPIAHNTVWRPYKVARHEYEKVVVDAFQGIGELCLYSHIPFCETRCYYCEYTVVGKDELQHTRRYMNYLNNELALYRDLLDSKSRVLNGFDIGGGTPSFVEAELIAEHVENVKAAFLIRPNLGISIETTPKIAAREPEKLAAYKKCGIERISMGIQVTQPDLLRVLNRSENGLEHQFKAVENIRLAGFKKFNVDLMYGFAKQSLASWRHTLEHAIALEPEYITLYRMRYKLTRISDQAGSVHLNQAIEQAALASKLLKDSGYLANPGKNTYSRVPDDVGTSDYLTRRVIEGAPYLGIGLGAQTYTHTTISYNDGSAGKNLSPYFRSLDKGEIPIQDLYDLPSVHMQAKMCAVSFYFGEIDESAFYQKFGLALEDAFPDEEKFVLEEGLMHYTGGKRSNKRIASDKPALSLTAKGAQYFNGVIALFFAPSVQRYLVSRDAESAADFAKNRMLAERVAANG